jgi:hypothetical protein
VGGDRSGAEPVQGEALSPGLTHPHAMTIASPDDHKLLRRPGTRGHEQRRRESEGNDRSTPAHYPPR